MTKILSIKTNLKKLKAVGNWKGMNREGKREEKDKKDVKGG